MARMPALPLLIASLALAALLPGGCEGTSSGVDNPGLTVTFRDGEGNPLRVTGDLDVFAQDQNPAVDPRPLATLRVRNSSFATLLGNDLERGMPGSKRAAEGAPGAATATRTAASGAAGAAGAAAEEIRFNLVFRSDLRTGGLAAGLAYARVRRTFSRESAEVERLDLKPRALERVRARLSREAVHGDLGRVFIPGTGFLATLVDGAFEFDGLPEGVFALRFQGQDGKVFPVREELRLSAADPVGQNLIFSAAPGPVDTVAGPDSALSVEAGAAREAVAGISTLLEARITGADSTDARVSVLWRQIPPGFPDTAFLTGATRPTVQALFRTAGSYRLEVSATLGARTARDTLLVEVRPRPVPDSIRMLEPVPGDTLVPGVAETITWDMPYPSAVTLLFAWSGGTLRDTLVAGRASPAGLNSFTWTPRRVADTAVTGWLEVRAAPPDTLVGRSPGFFTLLPQR